MSEIKEDIFNEERVESLRKIRELGIDPYPYDYDVDTSVGDILNNFESYEGDEVSVAGAVMSIREHGKTVFMDLREFTGDIQLYLRINDLEGVEKGDTNAWDLLNLLHTGDMIGVRGEVFRTRRGEISIHVYDYDILAKSLYPIPFGKQKGEESWYSVSDPRVRYKERYIYWSVYPQDARIVEMRARVINKIREFLNERGFIEVQTPTIEMVYGGAEARPFEVSIWALSDQRAYLRISPELYLKRFIAGGFPKVYTICQNFRNEGIDRVHNPEFTMLEWYEAYTDYQYQMKQFEDLVHFVVNSLHGSSVVEYQGEEIDYSTPWNRLRMVDAISEFTGFDVENATDEEIKEFMESSDEIEYRGEYNRGLAIAVIFEELCEANIIQPTFIIDHPREICPLTKAKRGAPEFAERFEPIVMGMEIGNAYSELTDPVEQYERFREQREVYKDEDIKHHPIDIDFIRAVSAGMPPTGGVGLGVDRLVMLMSDSPSIRDVISFPMMRPEDTKE